LAGFFARSNDATDLVKIADLARYPELMWLHKHELVPPFVLALLCCAIGGWPGLIIGFFWSTVLVYYATFCINSLRPRRSALCNGRRVAEQLAVGGLHNGGGLAQQSPCLPEQRPAGI
jgi:hypothetical protein